MSSKKKVTKLSNVRDVDFEPQVDRVETEVNREVREQREAIQREQEKLEQAANRQKAVEQKRFDETNVNESNVAEDLGYLTVNSPAYLYSDETDHRNEEILRVLPKGSNLQILERGEHRIKVRFGSAVPPLEGYVDPNFVEEVMG